MRTRRVFLASSVVALAACGLSAVGEAVRGNVSDGGVDGALPDIEPLPVRDATADQFVDPDAVAQCASVCDAGGCDAGTCVIDCSQPGACGAGAVKCPPGVPCAVECGGKAACAAGIDCTQASSCSIACNGETSCAGSVACSGSSCTVACNGAGTTCAAGVACDAGTCNIACAKDDCDLGIVECAGESCSIACGVAGSSSEKDGCKAGVKCTARDLCAIDCLSDGTCQGTGVVVANDGGARVHCVSKAACKGGVDVTAQDASILCGADDTCEGTVSCDAGHCEFACAVSDKAISLCCKPPSCVADSGTCTAVTEVCP